MLKRTQIKIFAVMSCLLMVGSLFSVTNGQENIQYSQGQVDEGFSNKLSVPLMNYKGRGIDLPVTLNYSSNIWRIDNIKTINIGVFQTITQAIYSEHSTAGWKTSLDLPKVEWPKLDDIYNVAGRSCGPPVCFSGPLRIRRVTIHMPNGSTHELRENDTPHDLTFVDTYGTFYAVDGSRLRYDSTDADTGTLYLPDGTRYVLDAGSGQMIDRNGNTITYNASNRQWTDTLGRVIGMPIPANPQATDYTYALPGLAGVNGGSQTYTFKWRNLSNVLTPGSGNLRVMATHYLPYPNSTPTDLSGNNYPVQHGNYPSSPGYTYDSLFYSDADEGALTLVVGKGQAQNQLFNPVVLHEIVLPDGRSYKFTYNVYGEITKTIYPTGAYEQYQIASLGGSYTLSVPYDQAERGITSRKLSENGTGNDLLEWTYSKAEVGTGGWGSGSEGAYRYRVVAPDNTCSESYRLKLNAPFHGGPNNYTYWDWDFVDPRNGSTVETRAYGASATACGGTLLRRELTSYQRTATYLYTLQNGVQVYAYRNIRPEVKTTILFEAGSSSALAQTVAYGYDSNCDTTCQLSFGIDQTDTVVYDYVAISNTTAQNGTIYSIASGNLLKSSVTTYSADTGYRNAHILGLPTSVEIRDASYTPVSRSEMSYDDSGYVPSGTHRALPTTSRTWDSTKGSVTSPSAYLVTHATFDLYGNRTIATDAKGFNTTTTYDSTYHAYPISVTTDIPDPSGTRASSVPFTTVTNFDPVTGLVLSTTGINGEVSTIEYNDPLLRPKKVTAPNGQETTTEYGVGTDALSRWVKVKSQITASQWTEAKSFYDGLGRTYFTQKEDISDPDGDSYTITCYDIMGRVSKTSSPFRNYTSQTCSSSSLQWTIPEYDDLSRTKKIIMPVPSPSGTPGEVVITYGISTETGAVGTTKIITDETGRQRKGITDALGNMVRVIEDPFGQNLITNYTFDALGNLRKTSQGDQNRYFMYDSLGRVLYARQVEQDANPNFSGAAYADPITSNNQWSVRYTYDDNSNILTTTNAAGKTIEASYDRLNRLLTRNYSDTTPDVDFYYDSKGLGTTLENALGKTTKVYSTVSESRYTGFDDMGRIKSSEQRTDGQIYPFSYAYNLAGALTEEHYPSGRVVKNTINADGELAQVQSKKNSTVGYFTYADAFRYNAAGAVTEMQLGNGHWETAKYNERQQVTQIGLGSRDDLQDLLKLDFGYTGPTPANTPDRNNGSMRSQTITVPAVGATPGFSVTQTYSYDSLNRLEVAEEKIGGSTTTWKQTFEYDRYGNRKFNAANTTTLGSCPTAVCNPAFPTDSSNRNRFLVNQGSGYTNAYEYDADGSVIKDATGKRYGYDAEGRQNAFFAANNSSGTPTLKYAFDGEGKRVKKFDASSNGYGTTFVYDALGQLVAEYETFDPNSIPEGPIASVSYMTTDHLGSPRIVTDASGAVVSRKDFAAFGDETITSHRTATLGYNIPDIRQDYTGYLKDEESGLEYAQARYYNPQHGRFTSVDPLPASAAIKNPQTFNRYTYALNSPHKFTDPLGLMPGGCGADKSNCDGEAGTGSSNIDGALNRYEDGVAETIKAIALQKKAQDASNRGDYDTMWDLINDSGGLIDTDAELNGNVTTEAFNQAVGSTAMSSTQPSVQQDDVTVTVSAAIDNPLAVDAKGYTYITGTETATYNCMSLGLGVTNTWLQPQAGETLEQFARRNGARRWRLGGRIPRGYTLMKTFEDSADPGNWHVMRRMGPGNWWSKNGGTPVYININNPDTFYRDQYTPSGTVDMKFFLVPRRTLTIPRNPYSTMRF